VGRYIYAIRAALGGFVMELVDRVEDEEAHTEIVFTDLEACLGYLRDVLGSKEADPTAAFRARADG
jgi:hypothetical protein